MLETVLCVHGMGEKTSRAEQPWGYRSAAGVTQGARVRAGRASAVARVKVPLRMRAAQPPDRGLASAAQLGAQLVEQRQQRRGAASGVCQQVASKGRRSHSEGSAAIRRRTAARAHGSH